MKFDIKRALRLPGLILILSLFAFFGLTGAKATTTKNKLPYLIKVNRYHNTVTVYEADSKGEYTVPVKAMVCSVGVGNLTPVGTFKTQAKYRWKELMGNVYGQYSTRIVGGVLFHSVYYYTNGNPATLATKEFNKLGTAASHGCVRLTVQDAKWIYDNCAVGTTVVIYDDKKEPGPLGKPEAIQIPNNVRWDPTDPSKDNPYKDKVPVITGAKNLKIKQGEKLNLLSGVKAKSSVGLDITSKITVEGKVDINKAGKYRITYMVTDALGRTTEKKITVTVEKSKSDTKSTKDQEKEKNNKKNTDGKNTSTEESETSSDGNATKPEDSKTELDGSGTKSEDSNLKTEEDTPDTGDTESKDDSITEEENTEQEKDNTQEEVTVDYSKAELIGVRVRFIKDGVTPDRDFALAGVEAYSEGVKLPQKAIRVTIEKTSSAIYQVTYEVVFSEVKKISSIIIDKEAPQLIGVRKRMLRPGEIVTRELALSDVLVFDNHTMLSPDDIKVTVEALSSGGYKVTYEVQDEAGNITKASALFYY